MKPLWILISIYLVTLGYLLHFIEFILNLENPTGFKRAQKISYQSKMRLFREKWQFFWPAPFGVFSQPLWPKNRRQRSVIFFWEFVRGEPPPELPDWVIKNSPNIFLEKATIWSNYFFLPKKYVQGKWAIAIEVEQLNVNCYLLPND